MSEQAKCLSRFYVINTGSYLTVEHPYAWGICDRNSNAILLWGNPSKEWAERSCRALNIVEGQNTSAPRCKSCGKLLSVKVVKSCYNKSCKDYDCFQ